MRKKGFSDKDILKWIIISAAAVLVYVIIKVLLQTT